MCGDPSSQYEYETGNEKNAAESVQRGVDVGKYLKQFHAGISLPKAEQNE